MGYYYNNKLFRDKIYTQYFNSFIEHQFKYMFAEIDYSKEKQRIEVTKLKSLLNSDYKKRIFLRLLLKVNVQIIGKGRERNLQLLNALQYNYLIEAYLHSPLLRHKLFALNIISDLRLEGFDDYILKLVTKKNNILRSDALVAILKLDIYDNLSFLSDYNVKLTIWDVNTMIKTIQEKKLDNINYLELISSSNAQVLALGIILARLNKRIEFKKLIKEKIYSSNQLVSEESFITFISFADDQSDYDYLMYTFEIATEKAQLYIVKSIVNYENAKEKIKFLNWIVENKSLIIKIEAIRVLIEIDLRSIERYKKSKNMLVRNACLQVLDFNLE